MPRSRLLLSLLGLLLFAATARAAPLNTDADGLAIAGYDPVAYFTESRAVPGDARFAAEHDGGRYHFASAANRAAFLADPARYLPRYGGYCAMGMTAGQQVDIDPTAFRVIDGALYLNLNTAVQQHWLGEHGGHIEQADEHWQRLAR